jgi:hypothetical protein
MIFCAAGDPGGSRAVLPVALELARRGTPVRVLDHGFLGQELPPAHRKALCREAEAGPLLASCTAFLFGSSATDPLPLALARRAKALGKPVIHVLDNWSSYVQRLRTDKGPLLDVDVYAVMDEAALEGALAAGIPEHCLAVTGHPGFAAIVAELRRLSMSKRREAARKLGLPHGKTLLAFVCEPFRQVFGPDPHTPDHPGFTEETVLSAFAAALAPYAEQIYLALLPHPKQGESEMATLWQHTRGTLEGSVLSLPRSRDILPTIDGIAGMASMLLYEAWLGGLPVLSMQPGCRLDALRRFALFSGVEYADTIASIPPAVAAWLSLCSSREPRAPRPELALHETAPEKIADITLRFTEARKL